MTTIKLNHVSQPQIPLFALNSMFFLIRVFSQMASSVCNLNCSHYVGVIWPYSIFIVNSPVLQVAEILQVEFSGVLCQINGIHILGRKQRKQRMSVI